MDLNIPLSGLVANQARLSVGAHNTANLNTDRFGRQRATGFERTGGGSSVRVDTLELSDEAQQTAETVPGPQNNVSLVQETVNRISAQRNFEANASVVRTQDRLAKTLLDLTG